MKKNVVNGRNVVNMSALRLELSANVHVSGIKFIFVPFPGCLLPFANGPLNTGL